MRSIFFYVFTILLLQPVFGQFNIDEESVEITFRFESKDVNGSISGFDSSSTIDFEDLDNSSFKGSVMAKTIETGNSIRDWSLKRSKYFNADDYPRLYFESSSVYRSEGSASYTVKGNLTLKGIVKPITWKFVKDGNTLVGTTTLFSSDFGINIKKKRADNKVKVKLTARLKQ
ncbi:YceI family protein [Costertonia aggregata]|uniref:YceI family protein n=1 Tax=Costertonia aggregata TaxID=343403 RepID=A0A7H9ATY4_9FLAO|nr:YceI family protein [Costertonia aggregata]QLG46951.1 YceI family protein [Costertonia aggregata]